MFTVVSADQEEIGSRSPPLTAVCGERLGTDVFVYWCFLPRPHDINTHFCFFSINPSLVFLHILKHVSKTLS